MSVIVVKKLRDKIIIGSDQQISYWLLKEVSKENTPVKLHKISDNVIFWAAWSVAESNCMKMFLEHYEPKKITDVKMWFEMLKSFKDFGKDYWLWDEMINEYLLITNWIIFNIISDKYIAIVDDFYAVWSWWDKAMACLHTWADVESTIKAVCAYDLFCSEPIILHEISL